MIELFTGEALFDGLAAHHRELSLAARVLLAGILLAGCALLVMTAVSLASYLLGGAPFIATSRRITRKIVSLAGIQPGERVYDLGCGDGRFLIEANKRYGAVAVGIEVSPVVCALAGLSAWIHGAKVSLHCRNFLNYDFSDADVIFCYLVPEILEGVGRTFERLKPGCRVISRRFNIPGQTAVKTVAIKKRFGVETIFIYRIERL